MFDLPVDSSKARSHYAKFRKLLLKQGFTMMQFSVYARYCRSQERSDVFCKRIKQSLPPEGEVRVLSVTDHQFSKMQVFIGRKRAKPEKRPFQIELF
jgi:CRISPR-associated protein Cas2